MRNYKRINQLKAYADILIAKRDEAYEAIHGLEEDAWDDESDRIDAMYCPLELLYESEWLEYPEPRNDWFSKFVASFGLCSNRRISDKQMEIFRQYCEADHYADPTSYTSPYKCRMGKLRIEAVYHNRGCWVNITETPTEEIERLISLC